MRSDRELLEQTGDPIVLRSLKGGQRFSLDSFGFRFDGRRSGTQDCVGSVGEGGEGHAGEENQQNRTNDSDGGPLATGRHHERGMGVAAGP
jgi:hypothetical protein